MKKAIVISLVALLLNSARPCIRSDPASGISQKDFFLPSLSLSIQAAPVTLSSKPRGARAGSTVRAPKESA